jgi:hypothetical protein
MADGADDTKSAPKGAVKKDVLFVHSPVPKGDGYRVVRLREDRVEVGQMADVKEGEPIRGEVVKLKPRQESPRLFDVEVVVPREEPAAAQARSGPAQVASERYRRGWDDIFGARGRRKAELLN